MNKNELEEWRKSEESQELRCIINGNAAAYKYAHGGYSTRMNFFDDKNDKTGVAEQGLMLNVDFWLSVIAIKKDLADNVPDEVMAKEDFQNRLIDKDYANIKHISAKYITDNLLAHAAHVRRRKRQQDEAWRNAVMKNCSQCCLVFAVVLLTAYFFTTI